MLLVWIFIKLYELPIKVAFQLHATGAGYLFKPVWALQILYGLASGAFKFSFVLKKTMSIFYHIRSELLFFLLHYRSSLRTAAFLDILWLSAAVTMLECYSRNYSSS